MILGVRSSTDHDAARIAESVCQRAPGSLSITVRNGVAIASCGSFEDVTSGDDYAYVGALLGDLPAPNVELRGDFALISRSGRCLRLARGRFGGRPLFWVRTAKSVIACSRLLPLVELMGTKARLNWDHVLAKFDVALWASRDPLPITNAMRVCTNTVVDIGDSEAAHVHYGPIRFGPELRLSTPDLAARFQHEFQQAVARQCDRSGTVAVFAGGGVDSSNLLASAVRSRAGQQGNVLLFAYDFLGNRDRPHLMAMCRHLNIEAHCIRPAEGTPYFGQDFVVDATAHSSTPGSAVIAAYGLARRLGAKVALLGDGSELLLNADGSVFAAFMREHPFRAVDCLRRLQTIGETRRGSVRRLVLGPLVRLTMPRTSRWRRNWHNAHRHLAPWAGPRLRNHLRRCSRTPASPPLQSQRERVLRLASSPVLMALREHTSRWEVACGISIALPYLDDDLVHFLARVPSEAVFAGARERGLLREAMEGLVPDSVRYRMDKAVPYEAFIETFEGAGGPKSVSDLLTMSELSHGGVVDASAFRGQFEQFMRNPRAHPHDWVTLWPAITAEAFLRWFREHRQGADERWPG